VSADVYNLRTWIWLPDPRERVFAFFADAHNLERITPPFLRFRVLNTSPIVMGPGALIDYQLRLHGVPVKWRTEITTWQPPERFCDVQLRGPYSEWVHTHTFDEHDGSTTVTLEQDGNGSPEEASHATANWEQVLGALRDAVAPDASPGSPS
jgi:ligand-binding SRPBCC domain-containing protein